VLSKEKNLKESVTKSKEFNFPTNVFDHLKPFDFMFEIDFSDMPLVMDNNIVYKALLYAKPLNGGNRFCIGAVENIDPTKVVSAEIIPNVLTKGDYRLEVLLTSQRNGDQPSPVTAFHEGSLIHVY